ncbi:hypothetical protein KJ855_03580 [Patescibacteria group bacterium]|nr:hypothetical protein [Patescibacteria group bacterium]
MQTKLTQFINSLKISVEQKDYLKLLIKEESENLVGQVMDCLRSVERSVGDGPAFAKATADEARGALPVGGANVDKEVDVLDEVLDYGDGVFDKAEETYDKVILSLKKNDRWLGKLILRVQRSKDETVKVKFVALLEGAQKSLRAIKTRMDSWWMEFERKKGAADQTLGVQVASMQETFGDVTGQEKVPANVVEYVDKLCKQYREKIDSMSKEFSGELDQAAREIDKLTDETSDHMKEIINEREQKRLMEKIMKERK